MCTSFNYSLRNFRKLRTREINDLGDIRDFFEICSQDYAVKCLNFDGLLHYRLGLIKKAANPETHHVVLDMGCGVGHYLLALAKDIGRGIGIDFSDNMITQAKSRAGDSPWRQKLTFRVDNAEHLSTIPDSAIDIILCIGALEHMPEKHAVLASGYRVLKPGGQIVLLTPNGGYFWYRFIAPTLGLDTKHLSTDSFLIEHAIAQLLHIVGFSEVSIEHWTFIPKGDLHPVFSVLLVILDRIGRILHTGSLRGGLLVAARKPLA